MARKFKPSTVNNAESFFLQHGGYSWDLAKETREEGKTRCAKSLAAAEAKGTDIGLRFEWKYDTETDESFRDTETPYRLWCCGCYHHGSNVSSLCGIDLGPDEGPHAAPYARVVEAELASEALSDID